MSFCTSMHMVRFRYGRASRSLQLDIKYRRRRHTRKFVSMTYLSQRFQMESLATLDIYQGVILHVYFYLLACKASLGVNVKLKVSNNTVMNLMDLINKTGISTCLQFICQTLIRLAWIKFTPAVDKGQSSSVGSIRICWTDVMPMPLAHARSCTILDILSLVSVDRVQVFGEHPFP